MKLCKDCKHFTRNSYTGEAMCVRPTDQMDPVLGHPIYDVQRCAVRRLDLPYNDNSKQCGPEAKDFVPIGFTWWERLWHRLFSWAG